jgi:hypothetical protein
MQPHKEPDVKMSVAQKEWLLRGRILMAQISAANTAARGDGSLAHRVALVTGGSRGIGLWTGRRGVATCQYGAAKI